MKLKQSIGKIKYSTPRRKNHATFFSVEIFEGQWTTYNIANYPYQTEKQEYKTI